MQRSDAPGLQALSTAPSEGSSNDSTDQRAASTSLGDAVSQETAVMS